MNKHDADKKADIKSIDRGEKTVLMEPLRLDEKSHDRNTLNDLAFELAQKSAGFKRSLPPSLLTSLATLVRAMNCYYSNLIEGHDTHPIDIERALQKDYSRQAHKRDLQHEARAHIEVQRWIDEGGIRGRPLTQSAMCDIHRRFCDLLPKELLFVEDPKSKERIPVIGGELRKRDVEVGRHQAISPGAVPRFLARFEEAYGSLGKSEAVLAAAAAHHRMLWIHPFLDGNGRVARLLSHASLLELLDTGSIWSIARGLARNVERYKELLANADLPRRNELDGRGHLSQEALTEFTRFFLEVCLDQVSFMEGLMQPVRLKTRIQLWAQEETRMGVLPKKSDAILAAILYRGELSRGEIADVIAGTDRHGRRIVAALVSVGVLVSESSRAPLKLTFPAALAGRWLPGLFPDKPTSPS